jgi:hypothetical protein
MFQILINSVLIMAGIPAISPLKKRFEEKAQVRFKLWEKCRYAECETKRNCGRKTMHAVVARKGSNGMVFDEAFVVPLCALSSVIKGVQYRYTEKDVGPVNFSTRFFQLCYEVCLFIECGILTCIGVRETTNLSSKLACC